MSPLRPLSQESPSRDPDLRVAARLLASTGPLPRSEARKRRVWNALGAGSQSRLGLRLTAMRVAFASVLFAAASSAAVGHYYIERQAQASAVAPTPSPAAPSPVRSSPAVKRRATPAAAAVEPKVEAEAPAAATTASARRRSDLAARRTSAPADKDAELLVEAMRARSAGDSQRVGELVAAYRAKHPQGVLQEEALMLSIESAVARRAPNAPSLAREYLARYPRGRFVVQARRALAAAPR